MKSIVQRARGGHAGGKELEMEHVKVCMQQRRLQWGKLRDGRTDSTFRAVGARRSYDRGGGPNTIERIG